MPYITVNKLKTFYFDNEIAGIPLVFIHGWLGSSLEWVYQLFYFNSRNHIILLDLPGFGKSDKPKREYPIKFFTKQVVDFLRFLGYDKVILIGHSLGGMIALSITIQKPQLVKNLILISTSVTFSQSIKNKWNLFGLNIAFRLAYKRLLKNIIKQIISTEKEDKEFKKLYKNALKIPKSVVLSTFKNMTSKFKIYKKLSQIYQPTLIIYGNKDKIISKSKIINLQDLISNSIVEVIEDGSHRVMVENHSQVNKIIDDFIKK